MSLWKKIFDGFKSPEIKAKEEQWNREMEETVARRERVLKEIKPKKPRKPKVPKTPKEIATEKGEAYISVVTVDVDKTNPGNGNFELDWNDIFIKELRAAGYPGKTDEDVVDLWFRSVCRNVLAETYEQEIAQKDNVRYINRKTGSDGRTEVS